MPSDLLDTLRSYLEGFWTGEIGRQSLVFVVALVIGYLLAVPLRGKIRPLPARPDGVAPERVQSVVRGLVGAALWPILAMGLAAAAFELDGRFGWFGLGLQDHVGPLLGFFLGFRLVDELLQQLVAAGPRRRRLRRGAVPVVFALAGLHQLGLLTPLLAFTQRPLLALSGVPITLFNIFVAILLIFAVAAVGKLLARFLGGRFLPGFGIEPALCDAIASVVQYSLVIAGIFGGIAVLGFDLTSVTIIFGALGVGIGFGLQTIVNNFVSGLILLFERSVKRGDVLTVEGTDGRVESIGLRASVVRTRQGDDLIMPNSILVSNTVANYSYRDRLKRVDVDVGVSYAADPNTVREILVDVAKKCDAVLNYPEPSVLFLNFGESSIDFQLRTWINDAWLVPQVRSRLLFDIWYALKEANIEIPFPQRDLHVRSGELAVRKAGEAQG